MKILKRISFMFLLLIVVPSALYAMVGLAPWSWYVLMGVGLLMFTYGLSVEVFPVVLCCLLLATPAIAAEKKQVKQVVVPTIVAVPVGIPVAPFAPYLYGSSQVQQQAYSNPPRSAIDILVDQIAERLAARMGTTLPPGEVKALAKPTVAGTSCATCHATPKKEGQPKFSSLADLSDDGLENAERAVLDGTMPPGGLSPEKAGDLLKEFWTERRARRVKSAEGPPLPPQRTPEQEAAVREDFLNRIHP